MVKKKCSKADKYDPILPPRCGCLFCTMKWQEAQAARVKKANSPAFIKKHKLQRKRNVI